MPEKKFFKLDKIKFAQVALNLPPERTFDYSLPSHLEGKIKIGQRVRVSFGPRRLVGYVVAVTDKSGIFKIKPLEGIIEQEPLISEEMLKLTRWLSNYYYCSWGEA